MCSQVRAPDHHSSAPPRSAATFPQGKAFPLRRGGADRVVRPYKAIRHTSARNFPAKQGEAVKAYGLYAKPVLNARYFPSESSHILSRPRNKMCIRDSLWHSGLRGHLRRPSRGRLFLGDGSVSYTHLMGGNGGNGQIGMQGCGGGHGAAPGQPPWHGACGVSQPQLWPVVV